MSGLENINWAMFLTPQEEHLIGSTPDDKYTNRFYTPKAIQEGYSVKVIDSIRQIAGTYPGIITYFVNDKRENPEPDRTMSTRVVLSPLNEKGETIHDPKSIDESFYIEIEDKKRLRFRG